MISREAFFAGVIYVETYFLPPSPDRELVLREITQAIRKPDREDAVQEAWTAHLEGKSVFRAVNEYGKRKCKEGKRINPIGGANEIDNASALLAGLSASGSWDGDE